MLNLLSNPGAWAALGVLLTSIGVEFPGGLFEKIIVAVGALAGIVGILTGMAESRREP